MVIPSRQLRAVSRTQGNNRAIKAHEIEPEGFGLDFEEVPVLVHAFRRMVREQAYDVCEMALTTYACAKSYGVPITALPIFLVRGFHHDSVVHDGRSGIRGPRDLNERRVGVNRGYTVTTGVWARGILQRDYGVDLDSVTWVRTSDEHVQKFEPPANVTDAPEGSDVHTLLSSGDVVAAVGVTPETDEELTVIPNAAEAALEALRHRGLYPINHLVVVRDDVLEANPRLSVALFEAFSESKRSYVEALRAGRIEEPTEIDRMHLAVMDVLGADPLPYGVEANRPMLDELLDHADRQGILRRSIEVDNLFAHETLALSG